LGSQGCRGAFLNVELLAIDAAFLTNSTRAGHGGIGSSPARIPGVPDLFDEHFICFLGKGVVLRCQWRNTGVFA